MTKISKPRFDTYCYIIWHNLPMMIIMTRMCQGDGSANKRIKPGERFCEVAANLMREEEEEG